MSTLSRDGDRLRLAGDASFETVPELLNEIREACKDGATIIDFGAVGKTDSAALALALELLRMDGGNGQRLVFENLPPAMVKLAELYSVENVIFPAAAS